MVDKIDAAALKNVNAKYQEKYVTQYKYLNYLNSSCYYIHLTIKRITH